MRIRYKLLAMLMLVAIPAVLLVGLLGYYSGQRGLRRAAFDRLTSIRESRAFEIQEYFRDARNEIWALSQGPAIIGMAREFREAARALEAQPLAPDEARRLAADLEAHYREEFLPRLGGSGFGRDLLDDMLPDDATARRLQYHYLVANPHPVGRKDEKVASDDASAYADAHARHHLYIRGLARQLGYYDIFMIDPETGRIVYSVFKEIDFGTSLTTGPHRESELARVFRAAREATDPRFVKLVDFAPYAPSYGAPASFIASPMFDGDELVAVLAAQMSIDEIDAVMTGRRRWLEDGFGSSGEAYLVGPDFRMRSNSRFLLEDAEGFLLGRAEAGASEEEVARMRRYGTTILQQEVRSAAAVAALGGSSATAIVDDYRGVPVLSSYMPLNISELGWVLLAEIDAAEAFAPVDQFARALAYSALAVVLGVGLVALAATRLFVRPLDALAAASREVSSGNLDAAVQVGSNRDEFGQLARTFNEMIGSIKEKTETIIQKNRENEELLLNILPGSIADRLKRGEETIADLYSEVTVLFADMVGFTELSEQMNPEDLVEWLNDLFTSFDQLADQHGVEKIKTIGDAYMAVCGLPVARQDHAEAIAQLALGMLAVTRRFNIKRGSSLRIRIGLNSGPVVAGVIGTSKFIYDLWGDTVNIASRMESHGLPDQIQVTASTYERLRDEYVFEPRGEIDVKGRGQLATWLLIAPQEAVNPGKPV